MYLFLLLLLLPLLWLDRSDGGGILQNSQHTLAGVGFSMPPKIGIDAASRALLLLILSFYYFYYFSFRDCPMQPAIIAIIAILIITHVYNNCRAAENSVHYSNVL